MSMKNISIWKDLKIKREYPKINSNKECDVLIIGGGITGISSYYHLKSSNLKVIIVEQNKVGYGITSNSTGKLTIMQNDLIDTIKNISEEKVSLYLKSQIEAIEMIKNVVKNDRIRCDLEQVDASIYTNIDNEINKLKDLELFLRKNGFNVSSDNNSIVKSKYMIKSNIGYLIHPLKFIYGLLNKEDNIYENSRVFKIEEDNDKYLVKVNNYYIKCKYIILASFYPYFIVPYLFPIKVSLEKSYLSASKSNYNKLSLISYSNPFISIRTYKDNLIYLSNSHELNKNINDKKNFKELIKKVSDLKINANYLWSNIDIITGDGLPLIGRLNNNMLIGTGYNTWGIGSGFLAGKILSDIILKKDNKYIDLFNPKRKIKGILNNTLKNIEGYINSYVTISNKCKLCPHAYGHLIYNEVEETYDCPCHGSRFNKGGKLINGPANKDIDI